MEEEFKSKWLVTQIELMKTLYGYEREGTNEEIGSIDYVANGDNHGKRLLKVIIDPWLNAGKVDFKKTGEIVGSLEKENYDEVVIMAGEFTEASKRILGQNNIRYITPDTKPRYSIFELTDAIQRVTRELCKAKCGKVPTSERDCKGLQDGKYTCQVRQVSDNADFHAERGWEWMLKKDFSQLVAIRNVINRGDENCE